MSTAYVNGLLRTFELVKERASFRDYKITLFFPTGVYVEDNGEFNDIKRELELETFYVTFGKTRVVKFERLDEITLMHREGYIYWDVINNAAYRRYERKANHE